MARDSGADRGVRPAPLVRSKGFGVRTFLLGNVVASAHAHCDRKAGRQMACSRRRQMARDRDIWRMFPSMFSLLSVARMKRRERGVGG